MRAPLRVAVSELLAAAASHLKQRQIRCALVGPGALAAHGVSGETSSLELLVVSRAVLDARFWNGLPGVRADVRTGAPDEPLAGVVRLSRGDEAVEVMVGKMSWQQDVLMRARVRDVGGAEVPVASVVDLILLQLHAGGPEAISELERLLAITDRESITEQVDARLNQLPPECARLWRKVLSGK